MSKKSRKTPERPLYSQRFLATYGRGLKREEIRLLQGFRGLGRRQRDGLLMFVSALVIESGGVK